ncbi:hypothetical protein LOC68_01755 [Blastopirellula sp. JC732]|uniref:Uncharacterized protein n=1 Tax=Blastopirellula sediminis TaxID=2894196 RepID=A0A9X1MJ36_9BACT|nr:hypothetical protein [Blastopirellula sediminis]MCC9608087.1 hypothetical protein [Blastopirellula sediminis]MCC9627120.1 hypothetical protein [Blastopirellula sediminis]
MADSQDPGVVAINKHSSPCCAKCGSDAFCYVEVFGPAAESVSLRTRMAHVEDERSQIESSLHQLELDANAQVARIRAESDDKLKTLAAQAEAKRVEMERRIAEEMAAETDEAMKYLIGDDEKQQMTEFRMREFLAKVDERRKSIQEHFSAEADKVVSSRLSAEDQLQQQLKEINEASLNTLVKTSIAVIVCENCGHVHGAAPIPQVTYRLVEMQIATMREFMESSTARLDRAVGRLEQIGHDVDKLKSNQIKIGNALCERLDRLISQMAMVKTASAVSGVADVEGAANAVRKMFTGDE